MEDEQSPREANKICGVCGDRALGYNFNAVSCESCKAFFRRNALKNKDFRCPFTENCNVTPVTRRFCQKCRLDKCFSIGMRKEYIMTEEDKVLKRQKIEQNRAKKRPTSEGLKAAKMKRELEDNNCDDTAVSLSSVTSVASTASEVYFWEADQKYADLEGNKQAIESMSPVTAASVPSPSSPENRDIIGSKTVEMQKTRETAGSSYLAESPAESDASFSPREIPSDSSVCGDGGSCSIPKENCSTLSEVMNKLQKPNFILKLIKNPRLVVKIFQDKSLVSKLADDPTFTKLIAENEFDESLESSNLSRDIVDNIVQDTSHSGHNINENPILTDLISKNPNDCGSNKVSSNRQSTDDVTKDVVQDVQRFPVAANSIESILCEAIKLEFSAYSALGGNQNSRQLNDAERAKLNELIVANKALLAPLDDDITNLVGDDCRFKGNSGQSDPVLLDVINLTAIAIRRLIKMSKKINAFKNMCQEDQLALLKGGCTEMMILRSALNYDSDKDMWKIPHSQQRMSEIKVDVLKEAKGNLYAEHAKFVRTFDPRWRDENIILILSAIALFSPDRPRVVHSDVIKLEQNSYYYLLRRYLESVYPGCEAKSTFLKLIQKISELHRLNNEVVGVYLNVNPSSVEPLLIEIFDLKH